MHEIEVSVPEVAALSARVSSAATEVRGALGGVQSAACVDAGDGALSDALARFGRLWRAVTEDSARSVDSTSRAVAAAAGDYQQAESTAMPRDVPP